MFIEDYNPILNVDSYKTSFFNQYPPETRHIYSYIESRGGRWPETLFFGLQAFVRAYLSKPMTRGDIEEAADLSAAHGVPFNRPGFERILDIHGGYWPLMVAAAPEGSVIPTGNVLATIFNTDGELPWTTSYVETPLLRAIWYTTTVATESWQAKRVIKGWLELSSDDPAGELPFKLHDFGARGAASLESAGLGGMAHLVNFSGTDTLSGLLAARRFYGAEICGFSIPATEHSTITSWGRENEEAAYRNLLDQYARPGSIVACVSDSYDLWNAIDNIWGGSLRQQVIDSGATLVVRPDSGNPVLTPMMAVANLAEKFGTTLNSKGYRVLNHVRVIQGDGVTVANIDEILRGLTDNGFSASNIAFGMGGKLLQAGIDRDTQRFAMKCSAAYVGTEWRDVYKDPITDPGKRSKRGLLCLTHDNDNYATVCHTDMKPGQSDLLEIVYENGIICERTPFSLIRERAAAALEAA